MEIEKTNSFEDQTERYLRGDMTATEFLNFEKHLEENPDLKKQVQFERQLMLAGKFKSHPEWKQQIDEVDEMMERIKKKYNNKTWSFFSSRKIWMTLIMFCAALLVAVIYFSKQPILTPQQIYSNNFQPYENVITTKVDGIVYADSLSEVMKWYDQHDYPQAISLINDFFIKYDSMNVPLHLYRGISFLEIHQTNEAIKDFQFVINQHDSYLPEARWYLALSYLRNNETEKAIPQFQRLNIKDDDYANRSRKILNQLHAAEKSE